MKILLLGATGRTGKWVLHEALNKGYEVTCLLRKDSGIKAAKGLHIIKGTPEDKNALKEALTSCEVLINTLNISRKSDFPWAPLRTPTNFLSTVMKHLISLSHESALKRVICCSAWGVGESRKELPLWFQWLINNSNIKAAYTEHERQENLLRNSSLNWTIVRPSGLSNGKKDEQIRESYKGQPKPSLLINRKSLASFLVSAIDRNDLCKQTVTLSKGS